MERCLRIFPMNGAWMRCTVCVRACVFFSSVFFLSLDKSIFIPTHRTVQANVNATAITNEKAKENRAGWVGTKIELWYCTLVWLYILYIRISSASFNFTGHIPHHLFTIARSIELAFLLVRYKCLRFACVASIPKNASNRNGIEMWAFIALTSGFKSIPFSFF